MSEPIAFNMTNTVITTVHQGKTRTTNKQASNFIALRDALVQEDWETALQHISPVKSLAAWTKGKFKYDDASGTLHFNGERIPPTLEQRCKEMAAAGEDPAPVFAFWERLNKNPSMRSVEQLWSFLRHGNIPLTPRGTFLAYKGVTSDLLDAHSRTVSNQPGAVNKIARNRVSDDPRTPCHEGFHVGALGYAKSFSQRVVICEVDPENVVCVPYDEHEQKMRVCEYKVIGFYTGTPLPNTVVEDESVPEPEDDVHNEVPVYEASDAEAKPGETQKETSARRQNNKQKRERAALKKTSAPRKLLKKYEGIHAMGMSALMEQSLDDLREYATKGLFIVGASKIPGGKAALATKILSSR